MLLVMGVIAPIMAILNWRLPMVRFAWWPLNYTAMVALLVMPWVAFVNAAELSQVWMRRLTRVALLPVVVLSALAALVCGLWLLAALASGADRSFELVDQLDTPAGMVRAYRTNGGAMTSFGIVVRHERSVLPGLRIVRDIYWAYPQDDVALTLLTDGHVRVNEATIALKQAVWL
jgi:hypothetical protein